MSAKAYEINLKKYDVVLEYLNRKIDIAIHEKDKSYAENTSLQHSNIGSLSYPGMLENKLKLTGTCLLVKLNEVVLLSSILLNMLSKSYVI